MWIQYSQSSLGTASLIEINPSKGKAIKKKKENVNVWVTINGNNSTVHFHFWETNWLGALPSHLCKVLSQTKHSDVMHLLYPHVQFRVWPVIKSVSSAFSIMNYTTFLWVWKLLYSGCLKHFWWFRCSPWQSHK